MTHTLSYLRSSPPPSNYNSVTSDIELEGQMMGLVHLCIDLDSPPTGYLKVCSMLSVA
jgi:hypothetical protein